MSKRRKDDQLGLQIADLPFSVIMGALAIIFWAGVNIMDIWFPSETIDVVKTLAYFIIIGAAFTIILDFILTRRER